MAPQFPICKTGIITPALSPLLRLPSKGEWTVDREVPGIPSLIQLSLGMGQAG